MRVRYQPLPLDAIQPQGWLAAQCRRDIRHGFLGVLDQLTAHVATDLFTQRIGNASDQHAWWDGESRGNWVWGMLRLAHYAADDATLQRMLGIAETLRTSQDADGYIGIYLPTARYQHTVGDDGELWTQSRALLILLTAHALTGDLIYLAAVQRCVALTMRHYGPHRSYFHRPPTPESYATNYAGLSHGLCYADVLVWLYNLTSDATYHQYARWLYADFSAMPQWFLPDDLKLELLAHPHLPWGGHAVHTVEHLRLLAWLAHQEDDSTLTTALALALTKLHAYCTPSGALIGDEQIHGTPRADSGYEFCTLTEQVQSLSMLLTLDGATVYADEMEALVFNAGQGARLPDGSALSYLSQDTRLRAVPLPLTALDGTGGSRSTFSPTHEAVAVCCAPNMGRLLPIYIEHMWRALTGEPGLAWLLFGPGAVETMVQGVPFMIAAETAYPFDLTATLRLHPASSIHCALAVRWPGWATDLRVTGPAGAIIQREGDRLMLRHTWQEGDVIQVAWQTQIRWEPTHEGEVAPWYGPLHYVLPIAAEVHLLHTYPLAPFQDIALVPHDPADAYHLPLVPPSPAAWTFHADPTRAWAEYPWDAPPCTLTCDATTLVPMGATRLRRASLPLRSPPMPP